MTNLNEQTRCYRAFYREQPTLFPLFHTPWWLDAACGKPGWSIRMIRDEKGFPIVFLPITYRRKWGLRYVNKPPLTPFLGPLWCRSLSNEEQQFHLKRLLGQIPRGWYFKTSFRPGQTKCDQSAMVNYDWTTRFTYQIDLTGITALWEHANRNARRNMKKGSTHFSISAEWDSTALYQHLSQVFDRQGKSMTVRPHVIYRIAEELKWRKSGCLLMAHDTNGLQQGSLLTAWDQRNYYLIATGATTVGLENGAFYALVNALSHYLPDHCQVLDFCGSMLPGVAKRNAGLGGKKIPFWEVKQLNFFLRK